MVPTPLDRVTLGGHTVWFKREYLNPYHSHKIYAVKGYIDHLHETGWLTPTRRGTLVVSSSGRFAEAMLMETEQENVDVRLVTDALSSPDLLAPLYEFRHLKAVVTVNDPDPQSGSHITARFREVDDLVRRLPHSRFVDQYADPLIPEGYRSRLFPVINGHLRAAGEQIGALFGPAGTGGLLNGAWRYRKETGGTWPIFAVDAEGSALFHTPLPGCRRCLPAYGNGIQTRLAAEIAGEVLPVWVADADAVAGCRILLSQGVHVGPSSGATAAGFLQILRHRPELLPAKGAVVLILPDSGRAYMNTVFNPAWLAARGLDSTADGSSGRSDG